MLNTSELNSRIGASKEAKKTYERRWEIALRFLNGEQHTGWDTTTQAYSNNAGARGGGAKHIVINKILPLYKNLLSRLSTNYPGVAVMPASPSSSDVTKAIASEAYLRYWWSVNKMSKVARKVIEYLLSTGTAAVYAYWCNGRVKAAAVSPMDLFFDAAVLDPVDSEWIAVRCWSNKKEVEERFPEAAPKLRELSASKAESTPGRLVYDDTNGPPGTYEIFEVYHDGKLSILCCGVLLHQSDMPDALLPVHIIRWTEVPNIAWGQGLVEPLLDLQRVYNASREMVMNNVALMSNPKWLVPRGAGLASNALTSKAGEKVFHEPGFEPKQVPAAPLPQYVFDNISRTSSDMLDTSGIYSATLGNKPGGALSGVAIDKLVANDLSSLQVSQNCIEEAFADVAKSVLVLTKAYLDKPTMIRQLDGLGSAVYYEIAQADLVEDPDVLIEAGTLFQDSIESRERRVLSMYEAQLIDKDTAMRELSFRTGNAYLLKQMRDLSHAREILELVQQGAMVELMPTDDKASFKAVFEEFMRDPAFYLLPVERQNYLTDMLYMLSGEQAGRPLGAPESTAEAAEDLGMAKSPVTQAQVAGMTLNNAQDQAYLSQTQAAAGTEGE
jgi:hypothetical protein